MFRLLRGSPPVLALLARNPFPQAPPKYLRAEISDYQFSDWSERQATGVWWQRRLLGPYFPAVALKRVREGDSQ